ncbi:MAG TPA: hypothetical protein PK450_07595 [Paracoccaceae bacterium]|nr:hypothetical protein [Paracoccaceae bacterium]
MNSKISAYGAFLAVGVIASLGVLLVGMIWVALGAHYHPEQLNAIRVLLLAGAHALPLLMILLTFSSGLGNRVWYGWLLVFASVLTMGPGAMGIFSGDFGDWMIWATYLVSAATLWTLGVLIVDRHPRT